MTDTETPVQWLISEYEATDVTGIPLPEPDTGDLSEEETAGTWRAGGSVTVQPIFTLKSVMDAGNDMTVIPADYSDPGRWWL
jgi:hypothetical protein